MEEGTEKERGEEEKEEEEEKEKEKEGEGEGGERMNMCVWRVIWLENGREIQVF